MSALTAEERTNLTLFRVAYDLAGRQDKWTWRDLLPAAQQAVRERRMRFALYLWEHGRIGEVGHVAD